MKNIVLLFFLTISFYVSSAEQKDPVLLTIDGKAFNLSEFMAIFNKNNTYDSISQESLEEYLDLYVKFKLKVREAESRGYDTLPKFIKEFEGYRNQLALPYLKDKAVTESLIKEAFDRMQLDVRASHILFQLKSNSTPEDTLVAYNKAIRARERILKGEDFITIAKELSSDPSVKKNNGDLGYFSVFQMVYPFESAAYLTDIGDISMPVRTKFGYHLLKVVDRRPARPAIRVAHIMVKKDEIVKKDSLGVPSDYAKLKIDEIYTKLNAGENFEALAKQFSDDKGSATRGGELPEFKTGKMIENFENTAYALVEDGDYSKPIKTDFGWHIIKRLELKTNPTFDQVEDDLKMKVARDSRSNKSKEAFLQKIKDDNGFVEHIQERNDFYKLVDKESYMSGNWEASKAKKYTKLMFGFYAEDGDKIEYTQTDFATDFSKHRITAFGNKKVNIEEEINRFYKKKLSNTAITFMDSRLSKTNTEFRLLLQEYKDGILLFDLTDEMVWSKAVKDTVGLKSFYENNKTNYFWEKRAEATIYSCNNAEVAKKVKKIIAKRNKKPISNDSLLNLINKDTQLALKIETGKFTKGENSDVGKATWEKGVLSSINKDKSVVLVEVVNVLEPTTKLLKEAKGQIISDYQNYLEVEWIKELKAKYSVVTYPEVLKIVN